MNNSYDPLLNCFQNIQNNENCLWVLDENTPDNINLFHSSNPTTFITNRFDVYSLLNTSPLFNSENNKIDYYFNDFNFTVLKNQRYKHVFYRISKEKPVTHHIVNQCLEYLLDNGTLYLCGKKNEGIKSLTKNITKYLNLNTYIEKNKDNYLVTLKITNENTATLEKIKQNKTKLDDKNYFNYMKIDDITIGELTPFELHSKPGVYGWKKIDDGSALLMELIYRHIKQNKINIQDKTALDLGCGSGIISLFAKSLQFKHITATDNNAAAIDTTKFNASKNNVQIQVVSSDCAKNLNEKFDYILCNPPFHKGFDTHCTLTQQFVESAANHASQNTEAWFVVNAFIGIERIAKKYFNKCITIENNRHFKVIRCIF